MNTPGTAAIPSGGALRIEMVLPALARAGMETVASTLAEALVERGHDVGFTCIEAVGELGEEFREQGMRVSVVSAPGVRPNLLPLELGAWFRRLRPDVVHAHSGVWLKAVQGGRRAGVPRTVFTAHGVAGLESRLERIYSRFAAARTDRLVAVSQPLKAHLVEALRVPASRVAVIPNGVSTSRYSPGPAPGGLRRSLGIPPKAFVVGSVARFHPVKNHAMLIEAFDQLYRMRPEAFLLLVGDGPLRPRIESMIRERGLDSRVRIAGLVADTAPLFRVMDAFALSSHTEGTSVSLLEAMASGVPVVATAVGGNSILLGHGEYGNLAPPGDAAALAAAIDGLLARPGPRDKLAAAARQNVIARYSVAAMVNAYEQLYRDEPPAHAAPGRAE